MNPCLPLLALVLAGAACWPPAWGQTIYRCGTVYSQLPCLDAITLDASDTRTPAQKAQADAAAAAAVKMAAQMEKSRLAREKLQVAKSPKKPKPRVKTAKTGASTAAPKSNAQKKKEPEYFTAAVTVESKDKKVGKKSGAQAQVTAADKADQVVKP